MKQQWKGFFAGVITTVLLLGFAIPALATYQKTATLQYSDVKVTLNGKQMKWKDEAGNTLEPFLMDGTTYLPVRALASALNLKVSWNQDAKTVSLYSSASGPSAGAIPEASSEKTYPVQLSPGLYVVGKDVAPGRYDAVATAGSGELIVVGETGAKANEIFGVDGPAWQFCGISMTEGDTINITNDLMVILKPSSIP